MKDSASKYWKVLRSRANVELALFTDTEQLQNDLNKLSDWSDTWLLKFHPEKCKHMQIGMPGPNMDQTYTLRSTIIDQLT
jgi:hypothetical protein